MSVLPLHLHRTARLPLALGGELHDLEQVYTLDGELNAARDNLVVVFHSLTGDARARHWWPGIIGPGCAIDTRHYAVLCTNLPGSCHGTRWRSFEGEGDVRLTPRDMAAAVADLVAALGVARPALVTGGSLGGMAALEWAASFPASARAVVSFAAPAAHSAQAIAWTHVQRRAIELAGLEGLALARMMAMISYRSAGEFAARFGRQRREDGRFQMQSYLDHQGGKLVERFDAGSYLRLLDAMDAHDVGYLRGGIGRALGAFRGRLVGVGIRGDLLYSERDVRQWTAAAGAHYRQIDSIHGHDAFLLEREQAGAILAEVIGQRPAPVPVPAPQQRAGGAP